MWTRTVHYSMDFLKKHPLFSSLCGLLVVAVIAGSVMSFMASSRLGKATRAAERAERDYRSALSMFPTPVAGNLMAAEAGLAALEEAYADSVSRLTSDRKMELEKDPVIFLPVLQKYIRDFTRRAEQDPNITVVEEEGFGFSRYVGQAPTPSRSIVEELDKQRQVLTYIVSRLFDSASDFYPIEVNRIARQHIEVDASRREAVLKRMSNPRRRLRAQGDHFEILPAVSASIDGAVSTLAFEVRFSGYTESLRAFLSSLASFDLPVVVRSIEVQRIEEEQDTIDPSAAGLSQLLGSSGSSPSQADASQKPVVDNNTSEFIVTLEYVEVVLAPGIETAEEVADE